MTRALFFLLFITFTCCGQELHMGASTPEKVYSQQFEPDSYYIKLMPQAPVKGLGVIIPGLMDGPASPLTSRIPEQLLKNGFAVIIPILSKNNEAFKLADRDMNNLAGMIADFKTKNKLTESIPIIIGGISIGGTVALRFYTCNQLANLKPQTAHITNVFAIDPPLNMVSLRNTLIKAHDQFTLRVMDSTLSAKTSKLKSLSVYYPGKKAALPVFSATKLRIYDEPDINWWITQKHEDLYDMNILDISAYINALYQNKHNQVELILTTNKGYRDIGDGKTERHPHSWSIADADDFIKWVLDSL